MTTVDVSLTIPADQTHCAKWIQTQTPHVVAHILAAAEHTYDLIHTHGPVDQQNNQTRFLKAEIARLTQEHETQRQYAADQHTQHMQKHEADRQKEMQQIRADGAQRYTEMHTIMQKQMEDLHAQRDKLQNDLQHLQTVQKQEMDKRHSEITAVMQRLTGNSATIGHIGETFVFDVHAAMQIGTLTRNANARIPGKADATWRYGDIVCLIEDKFGKSADDSARLKDGDIEKFEKDVKCAVAQGRINAALIISLEKRIPGRPQIAVDVSLGVPTVWASRNFSDAISARSLVELAFRTMVEVFSLVRQQGDTECVIVNAISNHLDAQMNTHTELQKQVDAILKGIEIQMKRANDLTSLIQKLISSTSVIRNRFPTLKCSTDAIGSDMSWWDSELGCELQDKWKTYWKAKKRHPKRTPLTLDLSDELKRSLDADPNLWLQAEARLKDWVQHSRVANRTQPQQATPPGSTDKKRKAEAC